LKDVLLGTCGSVCNLELIEETMSLLFEELESMETLQKLSVKKKEKVF